MSRIPDSADESLTYFCGWAITGRNTVAHLVASARFPLAGYQYRAWCGQIITVIALTLNARDLPQSCAVCNGHLRLLACIQPHRSR